MLVPPAYRPLIMHISYQMPEDALLNLSRHDPFTTFAFPPHCEGLSELHPDRIAAYLDSEFAKYSWEEWLAPAQAAALRSGMEHQ